MAEPSPQLLREISQRLAQSIPAPKVKRPKAQASWRQLKVGQRLELTQRWTVGEVTMQPGTVLEVTATDSQGVVLRLEDGYQFFRWSIEDWQRYFKRVRKSKA